MSTTIDQRVVEMRFDNKNFESNVATTLSTLNNLKQNLKMKGATQGLENISTAARGVNLSGISSAVDKIQSKFSAFEIMGISALWNISMAAVETGKRIVSALTIDPIKTGFSEYETQINAVQTIQANTQSKGTTLDEIYAGLDKLNKYADKTIYNFTEMSKNIGTFTAAGVDFDTSVNAIQGIANLAAVSGSTSQQASTAMYQLSQALSSGTVKLMDWNSVVNAGMGGQVFQDALKTTARVHGIAIDDMIKEQGSFRETLSEGWLTSEILTETLEHFTMTTEGLTEAEIAKNREMLKSKGYTEEQIDEIFKLGETATDAATKIKTFTQLWDTLKETAQSGWTQTWEILVGDFEEAKELLTSISDSVGAFIDSMSKARNDLLQGWKDLGGRTMMIEALKNVFQGILDIVKPIKEAFREIFPPLTVDQLMKFTEGFKSLTEKMKLSESTADKIKRVFKGAFALVDMLRKAFLLILPVFKPLGKVVDALLSITAYVGDVAVKLNNGVTASSAFAKVLGGIIKVVDFVCSGFKKLIDSLSNISSLTTGSGSPLDRLKTRLSQIGSAAIAMKDGIVNAFNAIKEAFVNSPFFNFIKSLGEAVKVIIEGVGKAVVTFAKGLVSPFANADFNGLVDIINLFLSGGIGVGLMKFINSLTSVPEGISDAIDGVSKSFEKIKGVFDGVKGCLQAWQSQLKAGTLIKIASAVAILAGSILIISLIDSDKLAASLGAITVLFADLMASLSVYSKIGKIKGVISASIAMAGISMAVLTLASALKTVSDIDGKSMARGLLGVLALTAIVVGAAKALSKSGKIVVKGASNMIIFAVAIKILASVCEDLSSLDWDEMGRGLVGVGALMTGIAIFLKNAKFGGKAITTATGIVILAAAIKILASACITLSKLSWNELGIGLAGIAGGLTAMVLALNLVPKGILSKAVGLIGVSTALLILSKAIIAISGISWNELGIGLTGIAGGLAAIIATLYLIPKDIALKAIGLIGVSAALLILAQALNSMGGMSWTEMAVGLLALGGALTVITIALNFMSGAIGGAFALLVAAGALAIFIPVLKSAGEMSWSAIGKGLLAMAGAFAVLGVAAYLLAPAIPLIVLLAGALALVGVTFVAIGVGLTLFSAALASFAALSSVTVTSIIATITVLVSAIIGFIPLILTKLGEGIIAICDIIAQSGASICNAVTTIIVAVLDALKIAIPSLIDLIRTLLDQLIPLLIEYVPKLIDMGMKLILGLLEGIKTHLPDIIKTGVDIIVKLLEGIGAAIPRVIDAGIKLIVDFINGMADGIRNNTDTMIAAVNNLMDAFIGAIKAWFSNAVSRGSELITNVIDGVKSGVSKLKQAGKDAVQGFINGLEEKVKGAWNAAKEVGASALNGLKNMLGINSPSKEFAEAGRYSDEGLIKGLLTYSKKVASAAAGVGETALDSMKYAMSGAASLINNSIDSQPTIRPVVDLSDVKSGAAAIGSMFNMGESVNVAANVGTVSSLMSRYNQNGVNSDLTAAIAKLGADISNMRGDTYMVNGVTYDDGTNISDAVKSLIRAAKIERRT